MCRRNRSAYTILRGAPVKKSCRSMLLLFVGCERPSNMLVYLRNESGQTCLRTATLRQKLEIKPSTSPSHSILTPGQPAWPDPIRPGSWQGSHWIGNLSHSYNSTRKNLSHSYDSTWKNLSQSYDSTGKIPMRKRESNPGSAVLEADSLSTRPTRRSCRSNLSSHPLTLH